MANILVLGVGPLPFENTMKLHAPGLRTWQLADVLSRNKHFVTIAMIEFGDFQQKTDPSAFQATREDIGVNINLVRLPYHATMTRESLVTLHLATRFTCVVSTTDIMNGLAADLDLGVPLWMDYNGDPFAEKQQQARVYQNDASLLPQWNLYAKGLLAGDRFSCCSTPQMYAMIGELGFVGRLTAKLETEDLIHVMPNCSRAMKEQKVGRKHFGLKGHLIPAEGFVVLWSGGYNTWSDTDTLFVGLELLMESAPDIHFVTTGGGLEGHDSQSFETFRNKVESSRFRARFHMLGWRATEEMASIFEQSDVAVLTDRYSVEGELGTRTRVMDWIQFEIPVVCSTLCESARFLAERELIFPYEMGSPESFRDAVLRVRDDRTRARVKAHRAGELFLSEFQEDTVFRPLVEWSRNPVFATDHLRDQETEPSKKSPLSILAGITTAEHPPTGKSAKREKGNVSKEPAKKEEKPGLFSRLFGRK